MGNSDKEKNMKLTNYFLTLASACDLSNDANYGYFKQNLAQIDSVIETYFQMENMTTRQEKRMNRVRERFEDKVDRVQSVAAELYCRCGDREEETAVNNLQLISQLASFGKRKRRDVVELGSEIDSVFDSVEEWYGESLKDCGRAETRLEKQVQRMRDLWKGGLIMKYKRQSSIPSSASHKEETSDEASNNANEALNNIMNLSVFG